MSSGEVGAGKHTQHFRQEFSCGMRSTVNNDKLKTPVSKIFIFIFLTYIMDIDFGDFSKWISIVITHPESGFFFF